MGRKAGTKELEDSDRKFRILCKRCNSYLHTQAWVDPDGFIQVRCSHCDSAGGLNSTFRAT